jgi:hypothetical protein
MSERAVFGHRGRHDARHTNHATADAPGAHSSHLEGARVPVHGYPSLSTAFLPNRANYA